jgi:hypothetical protein
MAEAVARMHRIWMFDVTIVTGMMKGKQFHLPDPFQAKTACESL